MTLQKPNIPVEKKRAESAAVQSERRGSIGHPNLLLIGYEQVGIGLQYVEEMVFSLEHAVDNSGWEFGSEYPRGVETNQNLSRCLNEVHSYERSHDDPLHHINLQFQWRHLHVTMSIENLHLLRLLYSSFIGPHSCNVAGVRQSVN